MRHLSTFSRLVKASAIFLVIGLAACNPAATPTPTVIPTTAPTDTAIPTTTPAPTNTQKPTTTPKPTNTPRPTATFTPTPAPCILSGTGDSMEVYSSQTLDILVEYPKGWEVSEAVSEADGSGLITIEKENCRFLLFVWPAEIQSQFNGDPVFGLESFASFSGIGTPDKEEMHIITINGSEFSIGTYSNPGGQAVEGFGQANPLFIAMHFAENRTVAAMLYATSENESEFRPVFENMLGSLLASLASP